MSPTVVAIVATATGAGDDAVHLGVGVILALTSLCPMVCHVIWIEVLLVMAVVVVLQCAEYCCWHTWWRGGGGGGACWRIR